MMLKERNSIVNRQKVNQVILVKGQHTDGEKFFAYVNLNKKIISLNPNILFGRTIDDIRKFGTIVFSGKGEEPSPEVRELMERF